MTIVLSLIVSIFHINATPAMKNRVLTSRDLVHVQKVSMPSVTPDGKTLFYVSTKYCLKSNKGKSFIFKTSARKEAKSERITDKGMSAIFPSVSPNGKTLAFIGIDKEGAHIFLKEIASAKPATRLTDKKLLPYGAMGPLVWAPDSKGLLFNAAVPPQCQDLTCMAKEKAKKPTSSGWLFKGLMYRHWNEWRGGLVNKLFHILVKTKAVTLITKSKHDTPPVALGGHQDYAFSPDGKEIAYVKNTDKMVARST
ncbi:hypothetical protein KJ865_01740, partial [Myxococcota bacterium]|nr:hypothetical protein [Myxococcota bacterium]